MFDRQQPAGSWPADVDELLYELAGANARWIRQILRHFVVVNSATVRVTKAKRRRYVDVLVPSMAPRLCCVWVPTGRVEFPRDSHKIATALGLDAVFSRQRSRNRAVITPATEAEADAATLLGDTLDDLAQVIRAMSQSW